MNGATTAAQSLAPDDSSSRAITHQVPVAEYLLALAATSIAIGIIWDISWHSTIGRDTFWTPAHMAIYLGGSLGGFTGGWLSIKHTFLAGPREIAQSVRV